MVVRFACTYPISAYQQSGYEFDFLPWRGFFYTALSDNQSLHYLVIICGDNYKMTELNIHGENSIRFKIQDSLFRIKNHSLNSGENSIEKKSGDTVT